MRERGYHHTGNTQERALGWVIVVFLICGAAALWWLLGDRFSPDSPLPPTESPLGQEQSPTR